MIRPTETLLTMLAGALVGAVTAAVGIRLAMWRRDRGYVEFV